ncbi:MAG: UDP-N-acetylglucosamine 2-epimerase [bacterium]
MRHVAVITGTRAEYGLLKPVLDKIQASDQLTLSLIVTGMHLSPEHGLTIRQIEQDGIPIAAKVDMLLSSDSSSAMAKGLGIGLYGITQELERLQPDILLILGDRVEAFAGAIAGLFCGTVVGHLHGGEITQGGLDEYMRHAITKLSHLHFTASEKARERVIRLGENPEYVFCVGAPGLDALLQYPELENSTLEKELGTPLPSRFALIVQHPISTHPETAADEIHATLQAVKEMGIPAILIYPNADAGSRKMRAVIQEFELEHWLKTYINLPRILYINLLRRASVLLGNSSSGMLDSASFGVPTINIGERQEGRERGSNVLDVPPQQNAIAQALQTALYDETFIQKAKQATNPYGDGKASERIVQILTIIDLNCHKEGKKLPW